MQPLLMFTSAVVPGLILMWYLHARPQYPQPRTILWATLGFGALATIPVIILAFPFSIVLSVVGDMTRSRFVVLFLQAFIGAALIQESFKLFVLSAYSCQRKRLAEPYDGVVYGVAASLGFATLENIAYVTEGDSLGALLRALTSVPTHAALGAIMGYFVAQAVFDTQRRRRSMWLAWLIPILLHGLYDFPLLLNSLVLLPISFVVLVVALIWAWKIVRRVQLSQRRRSIAIWGESGSRPCQFSSPHDLALDQQGNMYIADTLNNRVQKLSPAGEPVAQWGTTGNKPGQYRSPHGLTVDTDGCIFVADTLNHRIQKLSAEGKPLCQWGEQGAKPGQFRSPSGIAVDAAGNMFVADTGNQRIQKLSAAGEVQAVWGAHGSAPGEFRAPVGIAVDYEGWVYVADSGNHRIQKLSADGEPIQHWGEEGTEAGQFRNPNGIALDRRGRIYVADTWNNRIQELSPAGEPLFQWGTLVAGLQGQFTDPCGVAVDERHHVYVADTGNNCLHKIHPFSALMSGADADSGAEDADSVDANTDEDGLEAKSAEDSEDAKPAEASPEGKPQKDESESDRPTS